MAARTGACRCLALLYTKCGTPCEACRVAVLALSLFQLALGLLGKIKMFLHHLGRVIRKLFHVRIAPAVCFLLEFGQVLLVVLNHRIDVSLIGAPAYRWLFCRQFYVLLRRDLF